MNNLNNQFVKVPHISVEEIEVSAKDRLIYACIRRYMNKDTNTCFPSVDRIAKDLKITSPTVRKSIKILEKYNYFTIEKQGGRLPNIYHINIDKCPNFEKISFDFLDNDELTFMEKAYYLNSQQFLIKDTELMVGRTSYSSYQLENKIHMPASTIRDCNKSLMKKGYMIELNNLVQVDSESKCPTTVKEFDFIKFGQATVMALKNLDERTSDNEAEIESMKKEIEMLKRALIEKNTKPEEKIIL